MHIPLYDPSQEFELYEYIETPYVSPGSGEKVALRIHSDTPMIAVSRDDSQHQLYTHRELDECLPIGTGHGRLMLCPNNNIYLKNEHKSCVIGLFKRDHSMVREYCRWKTVPREAYAMQKNSNQFTVYLPQSAEAKFVCTDGDRAISRREEVNGHVIFTIQGLCRVYVDR